MYASMAPVTGRIAVVLPQGALFRQGAEGRIRQAFLENDLIDAVIGLAPNLFYGTGLAASILILRASKPPDRQGKVLVINGETLMRKGRNQNTLEPENASQLLTLYQGFAGVEGLAAVATLVDIAANKGNLNIPLYVAPAPDENALTLEEALAQLAKAHEAAVVSRAKLDEQLIKWGLV
jgi:type I restriction enzyme M protein